MTFERARELVMASGSSWTPMPENEFLKGTRTVIMQIGNIGTYVDHPYSQYVEIAVEYAILMTEITEEAWKLAFSGVPVFNAAKPRGISHVPNL